MLFNLLFTAAVVSTAVIHATQSEPIIQFVAKETAPADFALTIESLGSSLLRRSKLFTELNIEHFWNVRDSNKFNIIRNYCI
jgi:hypothetical protein